MAVDVTGARELPHRYAAAIDEGDVDGAAALFTQDAELLLPEPPRSLEPLARHQGRTEIRKALSSVLEVPATLHEITGQVVDAIGPDRAMGRVSCVAHHYLESPERPGAARDLVWRIRYDDEYLLHDGHWLIAARSLTVLAIELNEVRTILPRKALP